MKTMKTLLAIVGTIVVLFPIGLVQSSKQAAKERQAKAEMERIRTPSPLPRQLFPPYLMGPKTTAGEIERIQANIKAMESR